MVDGIRLPNTDTAEHILTSITNSPCLAKAAKATIRVVRPTKVIPIPPATETEAPGKGANQTMSVQGVFADALFL